MPEEIKAPRFSSIPKRGFNHILKALLEDTDHGLHDEQHPHRRRLKTAKQRAEWDAACKFLAFHANAQADKDDPPTKEPKHDAIPASGDPSAQTPAN